MKILLVAATEMELKPLYKTKLSCDIFIAGVGIAATIYHLQKKLQQKKYDLVIQAGIGGSFSRKYALGKTFIIKKDCFGDLGTEEKGIFSSVFDSGLAKKNTFPFSNGWLVNKTDILKKLSLPVVTAVTVNKVSDSKKQWQQLVDTFNPDLESMEGAAFHYVCLNEKIPFLQVRSISNYVGVRDKSKWKMKEAIENLNRELVNLLTNLTK